MHAASGPARPRVQPKEGSSWLAASLGRGTPPPEDAERLKAEFSLKGLCDIGLLTEKPSLRAAQYTTQDLALLNDVGV